MPQEIQTGALYQPRGVGWGRRWDWALKGRKYMYTYGWFMLRFDRKQQNSLKQLSFNKRINLKKKWTPDLFLKSLKSSKYSFLFFNKILQNQFVIINQNVWSRFSQNILKWQSKYLLFMQESNNVRRKYTVWCGNCSYRRNSKVLWGLNR